MNQRIEKLAEEAGLDVYPISITGSTEELEKFAELIVRECAGIVKFTPTGVSHARIIEIIKEHFGLEE